MHAKLIIADDRWLSIGSYNFNHLSDYTSIESNAEVLNENFSRDVKKKLFSLFDQQAFPVNPDIYLHKQNFITRFKWWISHKMATFLMQFLFAITSRDTNR